MIEKVEQAEEDPDAGEEGGFKFGFAPVWEVSNQNIGELPDAEEENDEADFWESLIQRAAQEKEKVVAEQGKAKRKARQKVVSILFLVLLSLPPFLELAFADFTYCSHITTTSRS